jgi:serine/threonine-protein kinase
LFSIYKGSLEDMQIGVVSLETGEREILIESGCQSHFITTGHLVYTVADGSLLAVPFNPSRLEPTGSAIPIMEGFIVRSGGPSDFSCSLNGSLVYLGGVAIEKALVQVDRQGTERVLSDKLYNYHPPSLSPDDKKIAMSIPSEGEGDIWIYDIEQDTLTRLTYEGNNLYPVWTPDGRRVAFSSNKEGTYDLYWRLADFSSPAEPLYTSQIGKHEITFDPDEKFLVFRQTDPTTGMDIWILPLDGKDTPRPFLNTSFMECSPMLSPDGRWLAYVSDETGKSEVYVRSFPDPSGIRRQVSVEGGIEPLWAKNGKELFYRSNNRIFAASVETEPTFRVLAREALFEDYYWYSGAHTAYDVNSDGTWFVMLKGLEQSSEVIVVQNWFEELKRLIPKGK